MKCTNHPDQDAAGVCAYSGKPYCADCLVEVDGKMYAKENLSHVMAGIKETARQNPMVFMNAGGGGGGGSSSSSSSAAAAASASPPPKTAIVPTKSKGTAIVLALLLGGLGAHKFYLGQTLQGFLYLLFCWTFIPSIVAFIEAIVLMFTSKQTFDFKYGAKVYVA
jgi:TM2 domain-containing membrane protein YozV